jgi:hypothetical protein
MDDMENKLGAILGNPEMMQKIMALAQNFNQPESNQEKSKPDSPKQEADAFSMPDLDFTTIQKLTGLAQSSSIDKNQQSLLRALRPYLSNQRINKLERAMRAAKMAGVATKFLGSAPLGR